MRGAAAVSGPGCYDMIPWSTAARLRRQRMEAREHAQTAWTFLETADREFEAGEVLQGSEKLWGAVAHAVRAVAQERGWDYGKHPALREAVRRLAREHDEPFLAAGFAAAEKFRANFYHDFMEDAEVDFSRPPVRQFIERLMALNGGAGRV